ncbi:uncharacterized protein FRV6_08538 [Fusarium oxysporum]|uniref:Uncharacterized protein n=1 Tax=Fusarium oxysporum TaxID=5507 RepID=A0A2H3TF76_FUSOX|nr:uncharacterized protein FRV6_08538 [Fusarium oxysporum]
MLASSNIALSKSIIWQGSEQ